ncbi:septation ring formation regulator EzrA [Bacillus taeanensis]|uniref:Septation ring formation regulator EzrA n=1 Tax=Bacillus taeanensis TaxID=273032 RepID=A0A366Y245_9BACI|nr:septation ring formation regulator EzrA [Bacillus taeanensis]RBW71455.1 septation ring formation regulator EzrA [Bacillus taeanensis]
MVYVIAAVSVCAAIVLLGSFSRKNLYKEIDRLEAWKIDITNRPVTEELAKLKGLNMAGETEEKFEKWRNDWDELVTTRLPALEEKLFDAEESVDKFGFRKARVTLNHLERELQKIEDTISLILKEVNELVVSEEQNRTEIEEVKKLYRDTRQYILAHHRTLGRTSVQFEKRLVEVHQQIQRFDELTEHGNHLEARTVLLGVQEELSVLSEKLEYIPELLVQLQTNIPSQLEELQSGMLEMANSGYLLEHLHVQEEIEEIYEKVEEEIKQIAEVNIEETKQRVEALFSKIEAIYSALENEVEARSALIGEQTTIEKNIAHMKQDIEQLEEETIAVQVNYRIEEKDLKAQRDLEKGLNKVMTKFEVVRDAFHNQKQAYSTIVEMVKEIEEQLTSLQSLYKDYQKMLHTLRKDELHAKETIHQLKKKLGEAKKMVKQNNLPGLPEYYLNGIEAAEERIMEVHEKLNETPLDIVSINYSLKAALDTVDDSVQQTGKLIEQTMMAEKLITYGNRYRSRYPFIAEQLEKAEREFRNYHYEEALKIAAEAVQKIEPEALRKIGIEIEEKIGV